MSLPQVARSCPVPLLPVANGVSSCSAGTAVYLTITSSVLVALALQYWCWSTLMLETQVAPIRRMKCTSDMPKYDHVNAAA